jgi:hypothetical protein
MVLASFLVAFFKSSINNGIRSPNQSHPDIFNLRQSFRPIRFEQGKEPEKSKKSGTDLHPGCPLACGLCDPDNFIICCGVYVNPFLSGYVDITVSILLVDLDI